VLAFDVQRRKLFPLSVKKKSILFKKAKNEQGNAIEKFFAFLSFDVKNNARNFNFIVI
jgi:hypothetical protein